MTLLLHYGAQRRIQAVPLGQQLLENLLALAGEPVKALVALVLVAPLEQTLAFQAGARAKILEIV